MSGPLCAVARALDRSPSQPALLAHRTCYPQGAGGRNEAIAGDGLRDCQHSSWNQNGTQSDHEPSQEPKRELAARMYFGDGRRSAGRLEGVEKARLPLSSVIAYAAPLCRTVASATTGVARTTGARAIPRSRSKIRVHSTAHSSQSQ